VRALTPLLSARYDRWPRRARDLELLARLAERHRSLEGFLDTYTLDPLVSERVEVQDEDDRVTLSTVHSAKGTEARVVYVAAATARNYPHLRNRGDADAVEEERRVLYVALTRAQDELIVSRAIEADAGLVTDLDTEYLLGELPTGLVTEIELLPRSPSWRSPRDRRVA
jgi:DNA helicase-2/ATP-dependent DNA helicase PcrA